MLKSNVIRLIFLFGLLVAYCRDSYGQVELKFLHISVQTLNSQPVQEKVYLHLDKPNYGFGDTIWYKAYTVIGQKHQLSALSGVLYVELISPKDSLVMRQIIPLVSGIGWSDIPLPFNLKPGSYRLRAYTRWMRNSGGSVFDEQSVMIGGITPASVKATNKIDLQFFPEGGELINGVRCRVAVKAISANGLGQEIKGTIEDNAGNIIADFTTQHLGMGVFAILPEQGKSYKAKVTIPGEASFIVDLPKAQEEGYALSVNNSERDSLYIKVAVNDQTLSKNKNQIFYIIAQGNGKVYYTTQGKLENPIYAASVAKSRFPESIVQFTLFSQNGEPIAERIAFIDNKADELNLNINTSNQTYNTRNKVQLSLTAKDSSQKPITGSFSVAVISESKVQPYENAESTILNNLLLTSELKGYIEQPNYYFTNANNKVKADLDLLMLTQGYRRYDWKQVLKKDQIAKTTFLPEGTQELSGTITTTGGKALPNSKITLAATKQGIFRDTTADENGVFTFTGLNITDTATIVIKARKANNGSNVKIMPQGLKYPKIDSLDFPEPFIAADTAKAKQQYTNYQQQQKDYDLRNGRLLKTVTIKGVKRREQPKLQFSSNLNGPGHANQVLMWDQIGEGCVRLSDCLLGRVAGVYFYPFVASGPDVERSPYLQRSQGRMSGQTPMAVIIDGVVLEGSHLDDISTTQIYSIEILRSGGYLALYGSNAANGAIVITTKRGGEGTVYFTQMQPNGITTMRYTGFYKTKAFYTPKYDAPKKVDMPEDMRTTIYWNPNILTDKDGKATMEFYNNDSKGTYRVVVEGIDDDGRLGRAVYRYEVK